MTDEDIVIEIAEKVMGWHKSSDGINWLNDKSRHAWGVCVFNPLDDDKICMMAWDKYAEQDLNSPTLRYCEGIWSAEGWRDKNQLVTASQTADRRRAMCECMAKGGV